MTDVILLGLAVAVVWKLYQWSRVPRDATLRSVTLCLLSAALSYPLAMPDGVSGADTVAGHGTAKLMQNLLLMLTVYFLMCFYLYSADGRAGRLRARREALVVAAVAAAIMIPALSVPDDVFAGSSNTADMTIPQVAFFYGGAGLYLMYALGTAGRWTFRYARMSRRPHATGLWMAAVGLSTMAVVCAVRAVFVAIRWSGGTVPQPLMTDVAFPLVVAIPLFFVGVTYPGARSRVTSVRLWLLRRRDHRRLAPLWQLLAEAYPENVLPPASSGLWDRWRARGVHRRYHRRIVECRDGLVDVSPYLLDALDGTEVLDLPPAVLAERLRHAVKAIGTGALVPRSAVPLAVPKESNREADVRQLIAVSDALRVSD